MLPLLDDWPITSMIKRMFLNALELFDEDLCIPEDQLCMHLSSLMTIS